MLNVNKKINNLKKHTHTNTWWKRKINK